MDKKFGFQILFAILSICIFAGTLSTLPAVNIVVIPTLEVPEVDFEQTEFEEDLFFTTISAISITGLISTKYRSKNLDLRTACILPVSPPPKHS